jgi:AcrR family transcriptional regulator
MQVARASTPTAEGRTRLNRDRVLRASVAFADQNGISSLSMRKLGEALGVEAMSIYNHVASKEELLDGMVDLVFAEIDLPASGGAWKTAMRKRAESTRTVLARHHWAITLMTSRRAPGPATLRHLDRTAGCFRDAGFSVAMAAHAMSLLDSYVQGFALQEASLPFDESGDMSAATQDVLDQRPMASGAFAHLAEMAEELLLQPGYSYGNEFAFGLGLILDGIETALGTQHRLRRAARTHR